MQSRLLIWVTSDCNLECPNCSQKHTRKVFPKYHMSFLEVLEIVRSFKGRGIRFSVIELTGGEPSLWANIKVGVKLFQEVCDTVTLVTNGNQPENVISLGLKYWMVSASQATKEQVKAYDGCPVTYINHKHRVPPQVPVLNSLPAVCCVKSDCFGKEQTSMLYLVGKFYYCCNAFAISEYFPLNKGFQCDFKEDYKHLENKLYSSPLCSYCICNKKVWETLNE